MPTAGASLVRDAAVDRAAGAAAEAACAAAGGRADAALAFAAGRAADPGRVAAAVCRALGGRAVAAVRGEAVAAGPDEACGADPGVAVAVFALRDVEAVAFRASGPAGVEDAIGAEVEAALGRSTTENDLVVVFADPLVLDAARLVAGLRDLLPAVVVGAGAARGGAGLACADRAVPGGACGLVIALDAPARIAIAQGCRPVTGPLTVTRVSGHWVAELDGKPALDVFREVAREPLAADLRRASERLLVAIPRGPRRGDFVARRISGFAPEGGAFALPEPLRVGVAVRLALRDADLAREDLARALASVAPGTGALYLSSAGRGPALFEHAGLETALVHRAFAPLPVAGLYGSFEIARVGGALEPLSHAGVLVAIP